MSNSGLILAFYRDVDTARRTLKTLRENRFRRTALLHRTAAQSWLHDRGGLPRAAAALLGGGAGLLTSRFVPRVGAPLVVPAATAIAGATAGYFAGSHLDSALPDSILKKQRRWLLPGETVLIAQGTPSALSEIAEIIRDNGQPAIFVLRGAVLHEAAPPIADPETPPEAVHTTEQLREAAKRLAGRQKNARRPDSGAAASHLKLVERLKKNHKVISNASAQLALTARLGLPVAIAAEWLLDNGYVIEGQLKDALQNLSRQFYADLPVLASDSGLYAGRPRVYALAMELVRRTDSRLDKTNISEWINAFQSITPLTMAELWALPLMLRIAVIENLRGLSHNVAHSQRDRESAALWANRLLNVAHYDSKRLIGFFADLAAENPDPSPHFADRLLSNLFDEETALSPVRSWLESSLRSPLPDVMRDDQTRQAAMQVSVANCITSLRHLAALDWRTLFEELSLVEAELRRDPAGVYERMDFTTRDSYRHEVEQLSRGTKHKTDEGSAELAVVISALRLGENARGLQKHVGYYLCDEGRSELEKALHFHPRAALQTLRFVRKNATPLYLGSILLGTGSSLYFASRLARAFGGRVGPASLVAAVLPASEMAVQGVNYLLNRTLPSKPLPKMNFIEGVPEEFRTVVVVPTILHSRASISEDIAQLEQHFLANPGTRLCFALLGDYPDAASQHLPEDRELLEAARRGIDGLNDRHKNGGPDLFFLFHRARRWSDSEERWMGWERKRGKLEEVNAYLKGEWSGHPEASHPEAGNPEHLRGIKFVITLDADTQMPHDTARRLIETLAHPLNRPQFTPEKSPVVARGYTLIQPRVSTTLPSATATRFARIFSDNIGLDPYSHVVSDVYQDLFGEGSYHGKGIYDLDVFHEVLKGRFPPAHLLSHDLLEGAHVRVGLASDIELLDDFPATYLAFAKRAHRWIRGDWQILDWILPSVPAGEKTGASNRRLPNNLSFSNRWKIADNLRRSLVAPATVAFLGAAWLTSPGAAAAASLLVAGHFAWPFLSGGLTWLTTDPTNPAKVARAKGELVSLLPNLTRGALQAALVPHSAAVSVDAIARVLYRRSISHRFLLEWETAKMAGQNATQRERAFIFRLGGGAAFSGLLALTTRALNLRGFLWMAPYATAWALLPIIVKWLHGRAISINRDLTADDHRYLRKIARQTWRYFDDFVGPHTNWLAPDNYQERLRVEIAQRTSPTNIGMAIMAPIAAHDFGFITNDDVVGRLLPMFRVLDGLEKYRGHLFNWYEVQRMETLRPRYVSVVDSGNFLGCLLALGESLHDVTNKPVLTGSAIDGLNDTVAILREALAAEETSAALQNQLEALETALRAPQGSTATEVTRVLRAALVPAARLNEILSHRPPQRLTQRQSADPLPATSDPRFASDSAAYWAAQIETQLQAWLHQAARYLSWQEKLEAAPAEWLWQLGEDALHLRHEALKTAPSLTQLSGVGVAPLTEILARRERPNLSTEVRVWLSDLRQEWERSRWLAGEILGDAIEVGNRAHKMADEMDFRFLYDADRKLFPIGFNFEEMRLDTSYYDLLASECRLASFLAVARGEVPVEHWLNLGRRFGKSPGGAPVLLSWSGTMFEYLMPLIFTPNFADSLLDWACHSAVREQIQYGDGRGVPWGISEAAFSAIDAQKTYQYKAFGVPSLGLKRGLEDDLVIAPYASIMALMVTPHEALANLRRLESLGLRGDYGFYESIDYKHLELGEENKPGKKPDRQQQGVIVRTFMVHHQGMSLLALDNIAHSNILQERFNRVPQARAAAPLLYEKIPPTPSVLVESVREAPPKLVGAGGNLSSPDRLNISQTPYPRVNLLCNGQLAVLTTNSGGGYLRWNDIEITRWRADTTRDDWGSFIYIRDVHNGHSWSPTHQPLRREARAAGVYFKPEKTEYFRRDNDIETRLEICVSPEDNAEVRFLQLHNRSAQSQTLEVTSFMELSLAPHNADRAHPAFSKLFVQTENVLGGSALLAWRRLRAPHDNPIWAGHVMAVDGGLSTSGLSTSGLSTSEFSHETDRARFLGRNRSAENPAALDRDLSNTSGAVLDPCFALRSRVTIEPGQRLAITFATVAGASREEVLHLVEKYSEPIAAQRAFDMAWTHAQLEMHLRGFDADTAQQFLQLASYLIYPCDALRAPAKRLRENRRQQSGLWAHGISGDLPVLVLNVADERDMAIVREVMTAHAFWRARGLKTDLVIISEQATGYNQELSEGLRKTATAVAPQLSYADLFDAPGGIFVRASDQLDEADLTLLLAVARAVLVAARGPLAQQLAQRPLPPAAPPALRPRALPEQASAPLPFMKLPYFNSLGGFTPDGQEYAIYLGPRAQTPLPWCNVIAGPLFGSVISESGSGFTWYGNSQSNRLTPWSNDPVSQGTSDAIYIRDDDTGAFWSPTPLPVREEDAYRARHGQGYSTFEHNSHALEQELTVFVPLEGELAAESPPLRLSRLTLKNASSRRRRLRITHYADWVLGTTREEMQMHIVTAWDAGERILLAHNHYRPDFNNRVAFASASPTPRSWSSDRTAFLGRNGSPHKPQAMQHQHLDERCGGGLDACAAIQVLIELEPGESTEVTFMLGEANDVDEARRLVKRFRDPAQVEQALQNSRAWWDNFVGVLQVDLPDLAVNFLLNRWLPYQVLSCRIWGRSAWYQSGGAFGFRDQLQDVMAIMHAKPELARQHILRAAAHQFEEGDVQHWWHPPSDAGVRTRFADDLLWLPYVTAHYVQTTGDKSILEEVVPFLKGEPLKEDEHEVYKRPQVSENSATLFEHCLRAINKGCTYGPHELPLIGTGDWNDGLNRVGVEGRGESVWMAWFLCDVLHKFAALCEQNAGGLATDLRERAAKYAQAVETHAWDGDWYLRAFFDDGSPMGAKNNLEAKIDSLPQSWAVLTGCANEARAERALQSARENLVLPDEKMILLFTPAFDETAQDPGYIKGYLPGVRENGGQYTHAAIWLALAYARKGDGDSAVQLLRMLNPVEHTREPQDVARYQAEPYVVAADVYNLEGHIGRGGWTWYTGSASWLYRAWIEGVCGFHLHGDSLEINPVLPREWKSFSMAYRYHSATYEIRVENPSGGNTVESMELDGAALNDKRVPLRDDGQTHSVIVKMQA